MYCTALYGYILAKTDFVRFPLSFGGIALSGGNDPLPSALVKDGKISGTRCSYQSFEIPMNAFFPSDIFIQLVTGLALSPMNGPQNSVKSDLFLGKSHKGYFPLLLTTTKID